MYLPDTCQPALHWLPISLKPGDAQIVGEFGWQTAQSQFFQKCHLQSNNVQPLVQCSISNNQLSIHPLSCWLAEWGCNMLTTVQLYALFPAPCSLKQIKIPNTNSKSSLNDSLLHFLYAENGFSLLKAVLEEKLNT